MSKPATVTVAGIPASVDNRNRFEGKVNLDPGPQTVSVVATDPGDNSTVTHNYQINVTAGTPRSYTRDNNGNVTSSTSPDGSGAPNATYEWDAADRLVAINSGSHRSEIQYDGLGRRVRLTEKDAGNITSEKRFLWVGNELSEERDASGAIAKRLFAEGEERIGGTDAGLYYYTRDHLGSIREMVGASGTLRARYDYDSFGNTTKVGGDLTLDFGYTGLYRHSNSNLNLAVYRAYDPTLGRWLSRDPIAERGGLNLHRYANNDPANATDRLGLLPPGYDPFTYDNRGTPADLTAIQTAANRVMSSPTGAALFSAAPTTVPLIIDRNKETGSYFPTFSDIMTQVVVPPPFIVINPDRATIADPLEAIIAHEYAHVVLGVRDDDEGQALAIENKCRAELGIPPRKLPSPPARSKPWWWPF